MTKISLLNRDHSEVEKARLAFMASRIAELIRDGLEADEAELEAKDEWPSRIRLTAPSCWACDHVGPSQHDPYGTGDSPEMRECLAFECPWGKKL